MPYIVFLFFASSFLHLAINNLSQNKVKEIWDLFREDDTFDFLFSETEYFNLGNINIFRYQLNNKKGINLDDKKIKGFIINNTEPILKSKDINLFDKKNLY